MSAVGDFFGKSVGASQNKAKPVEIDPNAYKNERGDGVAQKAAATGDAAANRAAPQATAAQQGSIREFGGVQAAPNERAQAGQVGPASQASAGQVNTAQDAETRGKQNEFVEQLRRQAAGEGPSVAENQLRLGQERNVANQLGVAAAQGGNPAIAARQAATGAAAAQRQTNADAASLRASETLNAQGLLGNTLSSVRSADQNMATTQAGLDHSANLANAAATNAANLEQARINTGTSQFNAGATNATNAANADRMQQAGLASQQQHNAMLAQNTANQQQVNLANMEAELRSRGMNDEQVRAMMANQLAQYEADRQAAMAEQQLNVQQNLGTNQTNAGSYEGSANRGAGFWGGVMQGAGSAAALALSDPASKSDVRPMSKEDADYVAKEGARGEERIAADQAEHKKFTEREAEKKALPGKVGDGFAERMGRGGGKSDFGAAPQVGGYQPTPFVSLLQRYATSDPGSKRLLEAMSRRAKKGGR